MQQIQCPSCGAQMNKIEGGISKRTGNSYKPFWSCPNNRANPECKKSSIPYTEYKEPQRQYVPPTPQKPPTSPHNASGAIPVSLSVLVGEILTIVQRIEKKLEKEIWADDVNEELNQEYNRKIQDENQ